MQQRRLSSKQIHGNPLSIIKIKQSRASSQDKLSARLAAVKPPGCVPGQRVRASSPRAGTTEQLLLFVPFEPLCIACPGFLKRSKKLVAGWIFEQLGFTTICLHRVFLVGEHTGDVQRMRLLFHYAYVSLGSIPSQLENKWRKVRCDKDPQRAPKNEKESLPRGHGFARLHLSQVAARRGKRTNI